MSKKSAKTSKPAASKKPTARKTTPKKNTKTFFDLLQKDKGLQAKLRMGWDEILKSGKRRGYKIDPKELHDHLMKKLGVTEPSSHDDPDTCICF
jgi:hypothetical protein